MFERYTDSAKRAIYFARFEAVHRGVSAILPEDLLLGLTWEVNTSADRIGQLKEEAVILRARVGIPHRPITATSYRDERNIPLSKESKRVIAYATEEANADRQFQIDTDHLLRALLRISGAANSALQESGHTLKSLRNASKQDKTQNPQGKPPWYWKPPLLHSPGDLRLVSILVVLILLFAFGMIRSLVMTGFGRH